MSQPAVSALAPLPSEILYSDGEPLESLWHAQQIPLLLDVIHQAMAERGRTDYFVAGNMFVYYSYEQARGVAAEFAKNVYNPKRYRGPDVFYVGGVERRERKAWVSWHEDGRLPDVIFEMLSPSTAKNDRTVKKDLYARTFRTPEYFLYDPDHKVLEGYRLAGDLYQPIPPDAQGRLWSEQLGLAVGVWQGIFLAQEADWVRLFHRDGRVVPTEAEAARAEMESKMVVADARIEAVRLEVTILRAEAEAERRRATAAEAEVQRLRALLGERGQS